MNDNYRVYFSLMLLILISSGIFIWNFENKIQDMGNKEINEEYPFDVNLEETYPNQNFSKPTGIYFSQNIIFITELAGKVKILTDTNGEINVSTILNFVSKIGTLSNEEGLVGFAFHPNFDINGLFYLHYTTHSPSYTFISEFKFNHSTYDLSNETVLLKIKQPYLNHNGGGLVFGSDGLLYIGLGDGGDAFDPMNNSQKRSNLLGSILRVNVNSATSGLNYSIPQNNPYVENDGYRDEIYAYGVRNPYKMSIDQKTGNIWFGDVGQDSREEINILSKGRNYGWNIYEGSLCLRDNCPEIPDHEPFFEYPHPKGIAIIGGIVYHGEKIPKLENHYIFGDWLSTDLYVLNVDNPSKMLKLEPITFVVTSITLDLEGEIYICSYSGEIYKLVQS